MWSHTHFTNVNVSKSGGIAMHRGQQLSWKMCCAPKFMDLEVAKLCLCIQIYIS